jgi:tetratricopeptide (TPR) repeat protein
VRAIELPGIRGFALAELSRAWQLPGPGGDFARSARLLDDALALIPIDWMMARADATASYARASRYRNDLPAHEAIARAIASYQEAERLYQRIGNATGVAGVLKNLAEAVGARQDRPRAIALRESLEIERKAIALARQTHPSFLAELLGNHAYGLTLLAGAATVLPAEQSSCLAEAGRFFEEALQMNTDPVIGATIENNRLIWRSFTATAEARTGIVAELRARLRPLEPRSAPRDWAIAAHNLADELFEQSTGRDDVREALDLWRKALPLRPIEAEPQFHWETAERLGELLASLYAARRTLDFNHFRLTAMSARSQAIDCLRSALRAARSLGPGANSTRSARHLGLLAANVDPGDPPDLTLADEALAALQAVLVLVPDDQQAGAAEADVAGAVARALALHRARTAAVPEVSATGATVLHDAAAWEVLHWMLRARGGQHRRLCARMMRPTTVSPELWTAWRLSLRDHGNWDERRDAVRAVQLACPSFLTGAPELGDTLAWMNATGGIAAMLLETNGAWLLGVLVPGEGGSQIRASVVVLRASPSTLTLADLLAKLRAPSFDGASAEVAVAARKELDDLVLQLRSNVLPDLLERMPSAPGPFLWSPHGVAAGVPLGLIWEDLPSIWTTPCLTLAPRLSASPVISSALLVLAESEGAPSIPGEEGMAVIARTLAERGYRVEALFGRGRDMGRTVAGDLEVPGLLSNVAPTPDDVKRRMPDHRLILILAHGHYNEAHPETSAIDLVDSEGRTARLTAEALSERPDLLHGAVVVLLSCETGAAGALSAAPAGLAGALLAVGAAAVVAPLWPVYCGDALLLGARVAHAIASGVELGAAVQAAIGRVRAELGDDAADESPYGLAPFVVWTG